MLFPSSPAPSLTRLSTQRLLAAFRFPRTRPRQQLSYSTGKKPRSRRPSAAPGTAASPPASASSRARARFPGAFWFLRWGFNGIAIVAIVICVNETYYRSYRVRGPSMAPTLSPDYSTTGAADSVLFRKLQAASEARRGDVVAFMSLRNPEVLSIKRVVATGGDLVYPDQRYPVSEVRVPWGHVWVEGDNPRDSFDSNDHGPISRSLIVGVASYAYSKDPRRIRRVDQIPFESRRRVVEGTPELPPSLNE